jgi:hypothetical protein
MIARSESRQKAPGRGMGYRPTFLVSGEFFNGFPAIFNGIYRGVQSL